MMATTVADSEQTSESRNAVRTAGSPSDDPIDDHGARHSKPATGTMNRAAAAAATATIANGGRRVFMAR